MAKAIHTHPLPAGLDCSHLNVVLTGGTSGIGLEAAKVLCAKRAHVFLMGSRLDKGQAALREIQAQLPSAQVDYFQVDLTSLASVRKFASAWKALGLPLHVLVLNAGTFLTPFRRTEDGFEETVASNYIGHFYLAHLLLDDLKASPPARLIWMGSVYEQFGTLDLEDIGGAFARDGGFSQYCRAKLMDLMAMREMARRLRGTGVDVLGVQPGLVNTPLYDKNDWSRPATWFNNPAARVFGQSARRGAISTIYAAASPELDGKSGAYLSFPYLGLLTSPVLGTTRWMPLNPAFHSDAKCRELYERTADLLESKLGASPLPNRLPHIYRGHSWRAGVAGKDKHHPVDIDLPTEAPPYRLHSLAAWVRSWTPF